MLLQLYRLPLSLLLSFQWRMASLTHSLVHTHSVSHCSTLCYYLAQFHTLKCTLSISHPPSLSVRLYFLFSLLRMSPPPTLSLSTTFCLSFHLSETLRSAACFLYVSLLPASSLGEVGSLATDGGLLFISMATLEEKRDLVGESNSSLAKESVLVIMLRPLLSSSTNATVSLRVLLGDMALDGAIAWSS